MRWSPTQLPEMRQRMVNTALNTHNASDEVRATRLDIARRLDRAELYWVSRDMGRVMLDASGDLPDWTPAAILPALAGIMCFAEPMPPSEIGGAPQETWRPGPDGEPAPPRAPLAGIAWAKTGPHVNLYELMRTDDLRAAVPSIVLPQNVPLWVSADLHPLPALHPVKPADGAAAAFLATLGAAWILMQQPTVADQRQVRPVSKAARRRAGDDQGVTLIDLRRLEHKPADPDEPAASRQYQHRWLVRGHWRQQPYGPEQSLRKPVWVPSYIKGPADAPLLERPHVHVWRR
jgi:hypothetical protein